MNINSILERARKYANIEQIKEFLSDETMRSYMITGVAAVFIALYLSFAVIPKFTELSRTSRVVNDLNDKIDLVSSRVRRLNQTTKRLEALREEQASYAEQLPVEKDIPKLLEGLASMAKSSKVKILSITPSELRADTKVPGSEKYYKEMPIRITAKSGYHQLGHFVSNLERGKRLIIIKDLSIRNSSGTPRMHDVRIVLNAYVSVEEEEK
ncbi:MAG: type 4a pilus biogenesis protein PilO [Candidatus Omnitrophica bacterium]|nr:type 4a pilus biogenesis protein PilO [Candidatus Omnitrophota bacterium]